MRARAGGSQQMQIPHFARGMKILLRDDNPIVCAGTTS
jgi:hypothetical protein